MSKDRTPVIVSAPRTAIGSFGGIQFKALATDLGAVTLNQVCGSDLKTAMMAASRGSLVRPRTGLGYPLKAQMC